MDNKEKIKQNFGNHLQKLRIDKNLSIRKLASSAGLEYSQVQRIENGKVNIALTTLFALAEGLDVQPMLLLNFCK